MYRFFLLYLFLLLLFWLPTPAQQVALDKELVAYYTMNGNGNDYSGNNRTGRLHEVILSEDMKGRKEHCYRFNGQADCYIEIDKTRDLDFTNNFSISWWIFPEIVADSTREFILLSKLGRDPLTQYVTGYEIKIKAGHLVFETSESGYASTSISYTCAIQFKPYIWYNIIVNYVDGYLKFYINGKIENNYARFSAIPVNNHPIKIGSSSKLAQAAPGSSGFRGKMDELRFYKRALNDFEVKEMQHYDFLPHFPDLKENEVIIAGRLIDKKTGKPIRGTVEFFRKGKMNEKMTYHTTADGSFHVKGTRNYVYTFAVKGNNYYTEKGEVPTFIAPSENSIKKDFYLDPYEETPGVVIANVLFEQSKAELVPESVEGLDQLYQLLIDHPYMTIEIIGHTDNQGNEDKNVELSKRRAEAAKHYLVAKGINEERITTNGFGSKHPIADNDNEESRKLNRRVEYKITGGK